eukprot:SAG31_NODE_25797_length_453_cov_54.703390_2_plen_37_part_01
MIIQHSYLVILKYLGRPNYPVILELISAGGLSSFPLA